SHQRRLTFYVFLLGYSPLCSFPVSSSFIFSSNALILCHDSNSTLSNFDSPLSRPHIEMKEGGGCALADVSITRFVLDWGFPIDLFLTAHLCCGCSWSCTCPVGFYTASYPLKRKITTSHRLRSSHLCP